jgi:hypothetical protein
MQPLERIRIKVVFNPRAATSAHSVAAIKAMRLTATALRAMFQNRWVNSLLCVVV